MARAWSGVKIGMGYMRGRVGPVRCGGRARACLGGTKSSPHELGLRGVRQPRRLGSLCRDRLDGVFLSGWCLGCGPGH